MLEPNKTGEAAIFVLEIRRKRTEVLDVLFVTTTWSSIVK